MLFISTSPVCSLQDLFVFPALLQERSPVQKRQDIEEMNETL